MPAWTRWPLRLPYLPAVDATLGRAAGHGIVTTIRWATRSPESPPPSPAHRGDTIGPAPIATDG